MKRVAVLLALWTLPGPASAQAVVYPTGDPAVDVANVRAAVQPGGTVLLKAVDVDGLPQVFDFGDYPVGPIDWDESGAGYVALGTSGELYVLGVGGSLFFLSIGNDVHLLGETAGDAKTTIRGGTIPMRNVGPRFVPGVGERPVIALARITVEGIRFAESALQPIYTTQLGTIPEVRELAAQLGQDLTLEIRGNEFVDVQPAFAGIWYGQAVVSDGPSGALRVQDNVVELTEGRFAAEERAWEQAHHVSPRPELWQGITVADLNAPGDLSGNRMRGVDAGVFAYYGGSAPLRIADNRIELRPEAFYGIACDASHTYTIERNTIVAPGAYADGISLWAADTSIGINHSTIRHNRIVFQGPGSDFGGITLFAAGTGNRFLQNAVEGSAAYALGLVADFLPPDVFATQNTFAGNQISHFTPRDSRYYGHGVHVFFDENAQDNRLMGRSGTVTDLGAANAIAGFTRRNGGPARAALRPTLAATRALFRAARSQAPALGAVRPSTAVESPALAAPSRVRAR